jgi:hypothetical protein
MRSMRPGFQTSLTIDLRWPMSTHDPEILRFAQNDNEHIPVQRFDAFTISFDPLRAESILNFSTKITTGGFIHATCRWNQSARLHLIDKNR